MISTITRLYHGLAPASRCHFIPVLTAGRQSRRLRRPTDKPENGGSSIFNSMHGTSCRLNWKEHNRHLPFAEDWKRSFSTVHTAPNNTWYNDYVMRPRSYSRGLRNRKTYANANANDVRSLYCKKRRYHLPYWFCYVGLTFKMLSQFVERVNGQSCNSLETQSACM